nr:transient receptor potential cation channel trpm-like [Leptinotarsa decemlineata]
MAMRTNEIMTLSQRIGGSFQELNPIILWSKLRKKDKDEAPTRSWIEATFHKRECSRYIRHTKDQSRCCCGRTLEQHKSSTDTNPPLPGELWYPSKCTISSSTDAYGILEFQGGPHPSKAQYIRVAHDTKPEHLMQLITRASLKE